MAAKNLKQNVWTMTMIVIKLSAHVQSILDADYYWPMNTMVNGHVIDRGLAPIKWHGVIQGKSELTESPSNVGLSLYGPSASIKASFPSYNTSCLQHDNKSSFSGLSVAFWFSLPLSSGNQSLFYIGHKTQTMLRVDVTQCDNIEVVVSTNRLNTTWRAISAGRLEPKAWHHVLVTWDGSDVINLYLNGSRTETMITQTSTASLNWSMSSQENCIMHVGGNPDGQSSRMVVDEVAVWLQTINSAMMQQTFNHKTGIPISNSGCSSKWSPNRQYCYRQCNVTRTWSEARHWCHLYSSTIVITKTVKEKQVTEQLVKSVTPCVYISHADFLTNESLKEIFGIENVESDSHKRCVYSVRRGHYKMGNCSRECSFMCKKDRGGLPQNAAFSCEIEHSDQSLVGHRVSVIIVPNQLECAIECLIHGANCLSYNYRTTGTPMGYICELNRSRNHTGVVSREGFQYCERQP